MRIESKLFRTLAAATLALAPLAFPAHAQKAYPTPMAAAEALVDGVARHDDAAIRASLGANHEAGARGLTQTRSVFCDGGQGGRAAP